MSTTAERTADVQWRRWTVDMQIVLTDPASLPAARDEVDAELDAVENAASRFRADSEISALAASGARRAEVSSTLADLLDAALTTARQTDGDVDPTVGAAMLALGDDGDGTVGPVSLRVTANWSMVELTGRTLTLPTGVLLDLGATAKAVAADRCAQRVHARSGCGVLINLGGDIATAGPTPDAGWQVLVQDGPDDPASRIALPSGAALATSSTVRRRWRRGDHMVHHILDPRTGSSAEPVWRTVSVTASTCLAANTVSTAAVVRGWKALEWIHRLGMPARLVDRDFEVHAIGGWP